MNKKLLIYSIMALILANPASLLANSDTLIHKYGFGAVLLVILSGAVVLGALWALIIMNINLIKAIKIEEGYKESDLSLWSIFYDGMTDMVPIEKEDNILKDHAYDGIQELDNNLPPWWLYGFYVSIAFAFVYLGYFHVLDYGMSSSEQYEHEMKTAEESVNAYLEKQANNIDENNLFALEDTESLQKGEEIFNMNCTACHLKGGGGSEFSVGPNLTDAYWLHGGGITNIYKTIKNGVPEKGMIAWKTQLKPSDIHRVASYIMTLQGTNPPDAKAAQGELWVESNISESAQVGELEKQ